MIGLLQRVSHADVSVGGETVAAISRGILALIAVERADTGQQADKLLERMLALRIFPDDEGRMNLSVEDIGGELLLVPNFTLAADTRKGSRPSFTPAASPEAGERLFSYLVQQASKHARARAGRFGAHMEVNLLNDGPVTLLLKT